MAFFFIYNLWLLYFIMKFFTLLLFYGQITLKTGLIKNGN